MSSGWVERVVEEAGYTGLLGLMFLENMIPPIPSEIVMPLGGYLTVRGEMTFLGVVIAGTAGSMIGAILLYGLGRWFGEARLRRWTARYGHWVMLKEEELDRGLSWFDRHGNAAVFFGRMVPGVRSVISIPAGMIGMPFVPFFLWSTLGASIWTAGLAWGGRVLGQRYSALDRWIGPFTYVVLGGLILAWAIHVVRQRGRART